MSNVVQSQVEKFVKRFVAGIRPRGLLCFARASKYIYFSAKAMITSGLQQRLHKCNVSAVTIKPVFVHTPITASFKRGLLWTKLTVAAKIAKAIDANKNEIYIPEFWPALIAAFKSIPNSTFRRVNL